MLQDLEGEEILEDVDEFLAGSPFAKKSRHLAVPLPRPKGRLPPKRGGKASSPSPVIIPNFEGCAEMVDDGVATMDQEMANGTFNSPRFKDLVPDGNNKTSTTADRINKPISGGRTAAKTSPVPAPVKDTPAPVKDTPAPAPLCPQPPAEKRSVPPSPRAGAAVTGTGGARTSAAATKDAEPSAKPTKAATAAGGLVKTRARGASFKRGTSYHPSVAAAPAPDGPAASGTASGDSQPPDANQSTKREPSFRRERGASFKRGTSFHRSVAAQPVPDEPAAAAAGSAREDAASAAGNKSVKRGASFKRERGASFKRTQAPATTSAATKAAPPPTTSAPKPPAAAGHARMTRTRPTTKKDQTVAASGFVLDGAVMIDDIDPLGKTDSQMELQPIVCNSLPAPEDGKESHPTFSAGAAALPAGAAGRKRRMSVKDRQRRSSIIRNATLGLSDGGSDGHKASVSVIAPPGDEENRNEENSPSKKDSAAQRRRRTSLVFKGRSPSISQV